MKQTVAIVALLLGSPEAMSMEGCCVPVFGGNGASGVEVGQKRRDPSDPLPSHFLEQIAIMGMVGRVRGGAD